MEDSDKELDGFLDENYEKNKDILVSMGFDLDMVKRVYIYLEPNDTDEAIHFMTEDHNKYNHPFLKNKKKKNLCLVCKKERNFHHKFDQNGEMIEMEENDIIYLNKHKNDNNNNNYNIFSFIWKIPTKKFKISIFLPEITLKIENKNIIIKKFIEKEMIIFLFNKKFIHWDYFILKYLYNFKELKKLLENLQSHSPKIEILCSGHIFSTCHCREMGSV